MEGSHWRRSRGWRACGESQNVQPAHWYGWMEELQRCREICFLKNPLQLQRRYKEKILYSVFFFTLDNHIKVLLMISCLVSGHTLKKSCVGDLSAGNDQASSTGCNPQPFTVPHRLSIFMPPGKESTLQWLWVCICFIVCNRWGLTWWQVQVFQWHGTQAPKGCWV